MTVTLPFAVSGDDFDADFPDNGTIMGTDCSTVSSTPGTKPEAVFAFDLLAGQNVVAYENNTGLDLVIHLLGACMSDNETCLGSLDFGEDQGVSLTADADGTYYAVFESWGNATGTARAYDIHIASPECGNGNVEPGEACDDGNTAAGDGCDDVCGAVEDGYACDTTVQPTDCRQIVCGDGYVDGDEVCDDGNAVDGDGCNELCDTIEDGYYCDVEMSPTLCTAIVVLNNGDACDPDDPINICDVDAGAFCLETAPDSGTFTCENPAAEACANQLLIATTGDNVGDLTGATDDFGAGCSTSTLPRTGRPDDVWEYSVVGDNVNVRFEETGSLDAVFAVRTTCELASTNLHCADFPEEYNAVGARNGDVFYIIMDRWSGTSTVVDYVLTITEIPILSEGDACVVGDEDSICEDGLVCYQDVCTAIVYLNEGDACVDDNPAELCTAPLECVNNVCTDLAAETCNAAIVLTGTGGTETGTATYGGLNAEAYETPDNECTTYSSTGNEQVFEVTVPAGQTLTATMGNNGGAIDAAIYLLDGCPGTTCLIGTDDGQDETLTWTNNDANPVTVFIVADRFLNVGVEYDYEMTWSIQ